MLLENLASGSVRKSYFENQYWSQKCVRRGCAAHYVISADSVRLAPGTHNERIIESNDRDNVNPFLTELGQVVDISWNVVDRTGWGEGTLIHTR